MNPTNTTQRAPAAMEQFVVFQLDHEEYAVPILSVAEVLPTMEITPVPNAPAYILGLTNLRGKILPVLDLERKFQLASGPQANRRHIMVAESTQKVQFGILVDQVKEVLKVPHDSIQPPPEVIRSKIAAEYLPGVIVLEDAHQTAGTERMILILDIQKILSSKNVEELHTAQNISQTPVPTS